MTPNAQTPSRDTVLLAAMHWKEVKDREFDCVVLPWGATEPHNLHLPFGTDIIESDVIAERAARHAADRGTRIAVLPTIPYGVNTGQLDLRMTISVNPSTQLAILRDIVASLAGQGIRRLVILNSHGGNDFRPAIRELKPHYPRMFLGVINWYQMLDQRKYFRERDDHAGEMETSILLAVAPSLVLPLQEAGEGKERPFRLKALRERWLWTPRAWSQATQDTGVGNPKHARAENGERFLTDLTAAIGEALIELAAADPEHLYE